MKRRQYVSLLGILFLGVVCIVHKSNNDLITPTSIPVSDVKLTETPKIKEAWFTELSDPNIVTIGTMDNGLQRTYKPGDHLFFNDSNAVLDFNYRNIPNISQTEVMNIKKQVVVKTKADQKSIPFTITAFDEKNSQGISIQLIHAPEADLIVQFHDHDGTMKEFTYEYIPLFTYQIHCPEDKEADYYATNPGIFFRVAPGQTYTYQVHFSLEVNRDDAINLLQNQMKDFDWSSAWKSGRDLVITLHTHPQDMYKKFLINFYRIRSSEGYILEDGHESLHGVVTEAREYEAVNATTGKVRTLFHKLPRYQKLDLSPNQKFYLATELQDDSQGEFLVSFLTLLDIHGNVIKHFDNQAYFSHWLQDGRSFVYVSGDSILSYEPAAEITKVIWTSPYKGIKSFYSSFDGLELDPKTGRMAVSINRLPGTDMDIGDVELYLFANINDRSPRRVANVSKRGNSSFTFQFDGNHLFYSNYFVVSDGSHWDSKLQLLDWTNLKITELTGFTPSSYLQLLQGGEYVYVTGDTNNAEWFRYDIEKEQSHQLFFAEHGIDTVWWIGKGQYIMHDFTGTYKFNLEKPRFEKNSLLPEKAEILGSQKDTIIYLKNPDPMGSF